MSTGRYATIIKQDDGSEVVSSISVNQERCPPREPELRKADRRRGHGDESKCRPAGYIEEVAYGVKTGMVRGGEFGAVGGFGWPTQAQFLAKG